MNKFAHFKITTMGSQTPAISTYKNISGEVAGDVLTLTSDGEFSEQTQIILNNWDVMPITRNNSSQITMTFPAGWTTIAFDIYEIL